MELRSSRSCLVVERRRRRLPGSPSRRVSCLSLSRIPFDRASESETDLVAPFLFVSSFHFLQLHPNPNPNSLLYPLPTNFPSTSLGSRSLPTRTPPSKPLPLHLSPPLLNSPSIFLLPRLYQHLLSPLLNDLTTPPLDLPPPKPDLSKSTVPSPTQTLASEAFCSVKRTRIATRSTPRTKIRRSEAP